MPFEDPDRSITLVQLGYAAFMDARALFMLAYLGDPDAREIIRELVRPR